MARSHCPGRCWPTLTAARSRKAPRGTGPTTSGNSLVRLDRRAQVEEASALRTDTQMQLAAEADLTACRAVLPTEHWIIMN